MCKTGANTGLVILLLLLFQYSNVTEGTVLVCITNCVQCKKMFGNYFQGKACGDACITSNGRITPDCNNPKTLGIYLKRFY